MPDPFLIAHYRAPLLFDIGGVLTPIAIRDQMIRGKMMVDRAIEQGLIARQRPLLVVGAGAAGATAAIRSAERGVPTTLIERESGPFTRQAGCRSRWIDPTQYDWPLTHWWRRRYPWPRTPRMPLRFAAQRSNVVAVRWAHTLHRARLRFAHLHVFFQTILIWPPVLAGYYLTVSLSHFRTGMLAPPRNFGMVLFSTGFGTERTTIGAYSGFRFWDDDPFERADFGTGLSNPRIFISGGGDGALQDFLRIVTHHKSAESIYATLFNGGNKTLRALRRQVERRLRSAEDQAQRAYVWGATAAHNHDVLTRLHQDHQSVVDWLLQSGRQAIRDRIQNLLRDPFPAVTLCHPCTHFDQCYALNRFLVLLISTFLQEREKYVLKPATITTAVSGTGHICANQPGTCHGKPHDVVLQPTAGDCTLTPSAPGTTEAFDAVIIRHGIAPQNLTTQLATGQTVTRPIPRQLLPYHAPS